MPFQDELPLGDDAIELVRDPNRTREPAADEPTDLADVADVTEPTEPAAGPAAEPFDLGADTADADWIADETTAALPEQDPAQDELPVEPVEPDETPGEVAEEPAEPAAEAPAPPKKKSRSSVPSWDEIMFGGGKSE